MRASLLDSPPPDPETQQVAQRMTGWRLGVVLVALVVVMLVVACCGCGGLVASLPKLFPPMTIS